MRAAWTQAAPTPTAPIVSTAEARNWVGLYGDSSLDAELAVCVEAAVEKVADFVGYRIQDTAITDHFSRNCGRLLELSEPGLDPSTIQVKFYGADGAEASLAADAWRRDPTAEATLLILDEVPALFADYDYPLRVEYTSKLANVRGPATAGRIKTAVRMTVSRFWESRGQNWAAGVPGSNVNIADQALTSLLGSCRIEPAVAA